MKPDTIKPGDADHADALDREAEKVTAKIDGAFEKLARKLRRKADKAKARLEDTSKEAKRVVLLRRFELYADAAHHLEDRLTRRREAPDSGGE